MHVENNKLVAELIADTLRPEGIEVDSCASGTTALQILTTDARYDLIIVDNDLPGINGFELIRRVRTLGRRRGTPILMLSTEDCESEAWRAGVDAFLRKPDDIDQVSATIARLTQKPEEETA